MLTAPPTERMGGKVGDGPNGEDQQEPGPRWLWGDRNSNAREVGGASLGGEPVIGGWGMPVETSSLGVGGSRMPKDWEGRGGLSSYLFI